MDTQEFSNLLNGRNYLDEITKEEEKMAKDLGYVVVFGYSDDNTEFRGAIYDESGTYGDSRIYLDENGIFNECDCDCVHSKKAKEQYTLLKVLSGKEFYWQYEISIPYSEFNIFDDGFKYCKGIIFNVKDLKK